jgi:hypothetical protein
MGAKKRAERSGWESALKDIGQETFRRWNDPVKRGKQFLFGTVDRVKMAKCGVGITQAANPEEA